MKSIKAKYITLFFATLLVSLITWNNLWLRIPFTIAAIIHPVMIVACTAIGIAIAMLIIDMASPFIFGGFDLSKELYAKLLMYVSSRNRKLPTTDDPL